MRKPQENKKAKRRGSLSIVFALCTGVILGLSLGAYIDHFTMTGEKLSTVLLGWIVGIYFGAILQIVIHEAGHLVFGLLTGYRFLSFRIGSFMWIKKDGKLHYRQLSLAGTGGQCLMIPPDLIDGKMPTLLYNFGGSIFNLLSALLFLGLSVLWLRDPFWHIFFVANTLCAVILAATNGIPMRLNSVDNDGYNAYSVMRSPEAMRALWIQLKVSEQITNGIRLKDMPEEWFTVPDDAAMHNSMVAAVGVFACNRLMDEWRFQKADALMKHLLEIDSGIIGIHRALLTCDRMFCEMITQNRPEIVNAMLDKQQKNYMKAMKQNPSVIRTQYVYELLVKKNTAAAQAAAKCFDKYTKQYPYPEEVTAERELMRIADTRVQQMQVN